MTEKEKRFQVHRSYLFTIAYRLVGNAEEAEDLVQEAWLRYSGVAEEEIRQLKPFLATMIRRLCLNRLKALRQKREQSWEPAPGATRESALEPADASSPPHPLTELELKVLLECLTPHERAVFILRELFDLDFEQISELIGGNTANCHLWLHRARERLPEGQARFTATHAACRALFGAFREATQRNDLTALTRLLVRDCRLARLPVPESPLFGRRGDLLRLRQLLQAGERRLLTLVGPPGVGKTRLGLELAVDRIDAFRDGVYFVPVNGVAKPELLADALCNALSVSVPEHEAPGDALRYHLAGRQVLLVLDNFEHLTAAATLFPRLLEAAPALILLVTSREVLCLPEETVVPVQPLSLPPAGRRIPIDRLKRLGVMRFLVERAQAARPDFAVTEANARTLIALCRHLEGLPLAVELAAPMLSRYTPEELLSRLQKRLEMSERRGQRRDGRHRSLQSSLDWSFELLDVLERRLFSWLGIFSGGATLEAIEAVFVAPDADPGAVRGALEALVRKSLVQRQEVEETARYKMLESVREYARQQLETTGELEQAGARHAAYFAAWCGRDLTEGGAIAQTTWFNQLEADLDNARAALRWALDRRGAEQATRLVEALFPLWNQRGHWLEGIGWLEAVRALEPLPSLQGRANVLHALVWLKSQTRGCRETLPLLEEFLALRRQMGSRIGELKALRMLAIAQEYLGRFEAALDLIRQALLIADEIDHGESILLCLEVQASAHLSRDDWVAAESASLRQIALSRELGALVTDFTGHVKLTEIAIRAGELGRATDLVATCIEMDQKVGWPALTGSLHVVRHLLAFAQRDDERAEAHAHEALRIFHRLHLASAISTVLDRLGLVAAARHDAARAAKLFGAAHALRESIGFVDAVHHRAQVDVAWRQVQAALSPERLEAAWQAGARLSIREAVAFGLGRA